MVSEFSIAEGSSVVSWSPPVPPNGVILYYNIRISRNDTGDLVILIEQLDELEIDVARYGEVGDVFTVEVSWEMFYLPWEMHVLIGIHTHCNM